MKVSPLKFIAVVLCLVLLTTNCVLAHSPEVNFWKERQKTTQLASLPLGFQNDSAQILKGLPQLLPQSLLTGLPKKISNPIPLLSSLPFQFGSVRKVVIPTQKKSGKTIIHIQDVHLNAEAQGNIGETIKKLMDEKKVDLVALEGAFKPI